MRVELLIGGMTCASCAARIEKKLNRVDGVTASVNYATEKASIHASDTVSTDELVAAVEATGYTATTIAPVHEGAESTETQPGDELAALRHRGHRVHLGRTLLRGPRQAPRRGRPARPAATGRQGCGRAARRTRATDPDHPTRGRRPVRRAARREDRHRWSGHRRSIGGGR